MRKPLLVCLSSFLLILSVSASPPPPVAQAEAQEAAQEAPHVIIAEAVVEPERWSELRFVVGGEAAEVMVTAGDQVTEGDVLVQLDATNAALAVQEAEAALATAKAQLALAQAGPRTEEIAAAEAELEAAQGDLERAVALRDQLTAGGMEAEIAGAQAHLEAARAERQQAQVEIDQIEDGNDEGRKVRAREALHIATLKVSAAQARLATLPIVSAAQLRAADAGVQAAQAQVDVAQAQLDLLKADPQAEEIAIAEAQVQQAEAALAEARVALDRTALRAPFSGTVTQVYVEVGDTVAAGQTLLVLATLDRLQIRTTDLTELEVVHVEEGQPITGSVDALPERSLQGHVARIKLQSVVVRGDVTYSAVIELDEAIPELLWGMTVLVEIPSP